MTEQNSPAVRGPLDATVVPLVPEQDVLPDLQRAASRKWQGDPTCQQAGLFARAAREIERLRTDVHSCHGGCSRAGCVNVRLRAALDKIAERMSSDDPCSALVQIARDALRYNV